MFRTGPRNLITDVAGLTVGNAADARLKSGVTVVLCEEPAVAGVQVLGGAPGTRETDLLEPQNSIATIHAVVLSGGSAFGLDAASGVQAALREKNIGVEVGGFRVPIVPAAILFDLRNGGDKDWGRYPPYRELGYEAAQATTTDFPLGTVGAGTGADRTEREIGRCRLSRLVAKLAIGRIAAPILVAAIAQVEEDRGRHDRHAKTTHLDADVFLPQRRLDAGSGIEAEGRAAGQHDCVNGRDRVLRLEQVGLTRARCATQHLDSGHRRLLAKHYRDAGLQPGVSSIADGESGDVGDQVAWTGAEHQFSSSGTKWVPSKRKARNGFWLRSPFSSKRTVPIAVAKSWSVSVLASGLPELSASTAAALATSTAA